MDALTRARRPLRNEVKKSMDQVGKLLKADPLDLNSIKVEYRLLLEAYDSLVEMDHKVMDQLVQENASEEAQDEEYSKIREIKVKVETLRLKLDDLLLEPVHPHEGSEAGTAVTGDADQIGYRLPKFQFKKFSGDLKDWLGFWAQFKKVDTHPRLDGSDKFNYLLMALEDGSEAYDIVSAYPQSNENYSEAVAALKRRFGNEDILLQVYIRELLKLVISNVNSAEKLPFQNLYLKVDSHLRALKTLKLESADPATWLFPLVESCLPDDMLLTWQRSPMSTFDASKEDPPRTRLDLLMDFMGKEVDIRQRMGLARGGFQETSTESRGSIGRKQKKQENVPTLAGFQNVEASSDLCLFCKRKGHNGMNCITAKNMPFEERRKRVADEKLCYSCMGKHIAKKCKSQVRCLICSGRHCTVMCRQLGPTQGQESKQQGEEESAGYPPKKPDTQGYSSYSNQVCSSQVALQTLQVLVCNGDKSMKVRAFLDSGSQRSYILKSTAEQLCLTPTGSEAVTHALFGGNQTERVIHSKYDVTLKSLNKNYHCQVEVRDQWKICSSIPRTSKKTQDTLWEELQENGIILSDVGDTHPPIDVLLGADFYGKLLTGRVKHLKSGPVAVETKLGWTLIGEARNETGTNESYSTMTVMKMVAGDFTITQLWDLDTIGVRDDTAVKDEETEEKEAKERFFKDVFRDQTGRYVVKLPWKEAHPQLPTNKEVAAKRLQSTTKKLKDAGLFDVYGQLFIAWEKEGFVELVKGEGSGSKVHYIPHRAVIKPGSLTTPVRPVFDASCKVGKHPSLNECLHKGSNYIQLIPEILIRFREKKIGFVADIRKAFQMIEVAESDRDSMRFLWWSEDNTIKQYRHRRVMFGANCSPFILGAVLDYHLKHLDKHEILGRKLLDAMYVDNCVSSEDTIEEYQNFRKISTALLADCQMDLRMWLSNIDEFGDPATDTVSVLGMMWERRSDQLYVKTEEIAMPEKVTKRTVLSCAQKVFDPVGLTCPAVIPIKGILQQTWIRKMKWEDVLPKEEAIMFREWVNQIKTLEEIKIPRLMTNGERDYENWELHTFTDASQTAYGAVVYLRVERDGEVSIQLVAAKSRVAPVKRVTINRLELLGCLIGARLCTSVKTALGVDQVTEYYWCDNSTALAWIRRDDSWGTFVGNRTAEINRLTRKEDWAHVPGKMNPADLPSRGCTPVELLQSRWWLGPTWLYIRESWPNSQPEINEEEIAEEMKKSMKVGAEISMSILDFEKKQRSFASCVRITGWVKRFVYNTKCKTSERRSGPLKLDELAEAEDFIVYGIQDAFRGESKERLSGLEVFQDKNKLLRVKSRIVARKDLGVFNRPVLLPGKHPLVRQLIEDYHKAFCQAGVGFLLIKLRKKYWILQARKTVKGVIGKCQRCRRYAAKPIVTETAPLPLDRIKDAEVFEVVGVDLAGPLILKNQKKVWLVIITCAVYRAVYLDLVDSLSTRAFVRILKRFVERYRRPAIIYSDNGTNFRGSDNLFRSLDWEAIQKDESIQPITWKFNPPSGPWWGGWWERLIRTVKDLLRRTVGKASLSKKELEETLKVIQDVMNDRPLTYVSESVDDLEPLTPNMFLQPSGSSKFPEGYLTESEKLRVRFRFMKTLWAELKQRFQKEYLSLLVSKSRKTPSRGLKIGELVVVGDDKKKRLEWPLGRVLELYPGKDGVVRVAKIMTQGGEFLRPVQRLYPLELDGDPQVGHRMQTRSRTNIVRA